MVAETFNNWFNNIVRNLLTLTNKNFPKRKVNGFYINLLDPIEAAISKYKNHPSLNAIRGKVSILDNPKFDFNYTFLDQTWKELKKLGPKKVINEEIKNNQRK